MLTTVDYAALSPFLILLFGCLALLIMESISGQYAKKYSFWVTLVFLIAALIAVYLAPATSNPLIANWLQFDSTGRIFSFLFLAIGISTALLSQSFFNRFEAPHGEYFFLLIASVFGLLLIAYASDFLTLFLGIETLSMALYIWCGYMKHWEISNEASLKYFLMGAIAAAFFLYGIALLYGAFGTTQFAALKQFATANQTLFYSGIAFLTLGLAFKAAIVPFHIWAPDVYCGAPTPVTAFMAVGTKAGAFAALFRIFLSALPHFDPRFNELLSILALITLVFANYVALRQENLRRFFAYSGISHAGFLLFPFVANTVQSPDALLFYLLIYTCATLGAFAVLTFLDDKPAGVMLEDLKGLYYRSPLLACFLAIFLMTLGGMPPTAGFFAKFFIFKNAFEAGYYALVIVGLLVAILSAYYYFRIASAMFKTDEKGAVPLGRMVPAFLVGLAAFAAIVMLSLFPGKMFI